MSEERKTDRLAVLRSASLIALVFGAIGSIGLLRHAQRHPPPIIVIGFVVWVVAPFAVLGVANLLSTGWPTKIRATLYIVTLLVAAASVAIYFDDSVAHRTARPAGVYVAVPPASVLLGAIVLTVAGFISRTGHRTK